MHVHLTRSTSATDLADRRGVSVHILSDRLRTLDDGVTWQLTAHVAFTDHGDDRS